MTRAASAFHVHFTPTSASWVNAVEGFFAKLTRQRLKRGVFLSLISLQEAINRYVAHANNEPRSFRWTQDPDKIIAAVRRGDQVLDLLYYELIFVRASVADGNSPKMPR